MFWVRMIAITGFFVVAAPRVAWAWGPGMHMAIGRDILGMLHLLPAAVAAVLWKHRRDFLFGNIAADVVVGKRLSRVKQICHQWRTGWGMLESAETKRARACAYGYLSHLAADTVAHNKYVPRQLLTTRAAASLGHLYWEMRADATVEVDLWVEMRRLVPEVAAEHRANLHAHLTDTFLPFGVNWHLFNRLNRLATQRRWRRIVRHWDQMSDRPLPAELIRAYRAECVRRAVDVLVHGDASLVCYEDPNGNAALTYARHRRRLLRQMARAGVMRSHTYREAVFGQSPSTSTGA
jgi:hypothetical protein